MALVETIERPIDSGIFGGRCAPHVFCLSPEVAANYDTGWDEDARVLEAIEKLNGVTAAGINSFMDLTVLRLGRDIPRTPANLRAVPI